MTTAAGPTATWHRRAARSAVARPRSNATSSASECSGCRADGSPPVSRAGRDHLVGRASSSPAPFPSRGREAHRGPVERRRKGVGVGRRAGMVRIGSPRACRRRRLRPRRRGAGVPRDRPGAGEWSVPVDDIGGTGGRAGGDAELATAVAGGQPVALGLLGAGASIDPGSGAVDGDLQIVDGAEVDLVLVPGPDVTPVVASVTLRVSPRSSASTPQPGCRERRHIVFARW